tara:strand:- start:4844 stop:15754 length:10911 start_codon:yes stop_codon:yes gene_type:complete
MGWTTRLPDGKIWEFPDEVTPDQVTRALMKEGAYGDLPSGFFNAVQSGIAGVTGRLGALPDLASAAITGDQEDYEAGILALEEAERAERRHLPMPTSFEDVQEAWDEGGAGNILGTAGSYIAETAGKSAPYLVPQFAATRWGIPIASRLSPTLGKVLGETARPGTRMLTRTALGSASMLPVYVADNMSRQVQAGAATPEDLSLLNATLAGTGQSFAEQMFVMVMGGQGRALQRNAAQSLKDWLPKRLAEGLLEAPVEVIQQTLERLQAGESISPSDEGYMREVVEAAVGGATVGTVYAGGFSINEARQRKKLQEAYKKAEPKEKELRESELEKAWKTQMGLDEQAARDQGQDALRRWQLGFREAQDTGDLEKQAAYERLEAEIETTKDDVIAAAQARNIKVDDDGFRAFTSRTLNHLDEDGKRVQGKRHLDDLDAQEMHLVYNTLTAMPVRYGAAQVEQSLPMFSDEEYQTALAYHESKRKRKPKKKAKAKKGEAKEEATYSKGVTLQSIRQSLGFFTGSDKFNNDIANQILTRMKSRRDVVRKGKRLVFREKRYTEDQYSKMLNDAIDKGQLTTAIIERTLSRTNPRLINEVKNDMLARGDVSKVNNRYVPKINREGEIVGVVDVEEFNGWLIRDPVDKSIIGGARNRNEAREKRNKIRDDSNRWDLFVDGELYQTYATKHAQKSATTALRRIKKSNPGVKASIKQRVGVVSPVAEKMFSVFERTRGPSGQEGKRDNEYFDSRVRAEEAKGKLIVGLSGLNPRQDRVEQAKVTESARIDKDIERRRREAEPTQSEIERRETVLSLLEDSLSAVGLNDIRLALVDSMSETGAEGSYDLNRIINLALDKVDPNLSYEEQAKELGRFMDHELMHSLVNLDLLDKEELDMLASYGLRTMDPNFPNMSLVKVQEAMHEQLARREKDSRYLLTRRDALEEGMAQGYRHYNAAKDKDPDAPVAVMDKINMFFDRFGNHLAGYGFRSAEDVFDAIRAGEVGLRKRGVVRNLRLAREINDNIVETADASMRADKGQPLTPDEIDSLSDAEFEKYSLDPSSIQPWEWMIPPWDSKQDDGGEVVSARFNVDVPGRSEPKSVVVDLEHYASQAKGSWEVAFLATDESGDLNTKLDKGAGAQATREVFATVLDILSEFIDSKSKAGEKPVSLEIDGEGKSRVRYYSTVLRRYAPRMGYEISKNLTDISDDGSMGRWVLLDKDLKSALKEPKFSLDPSELLGGDLYSPLARALSESPQRKMTVAQLRAHLRKQGVRKDEIDWSLEEHLEGMEPGDKLNLDDLQEKVVFIRLDETVLGDGPKYQFGTPEEQDAALARLHAARVKVNAFQFSATTLGQSRGEVAQREDAEWDALTEEFEEAERAMKDIVPGWGRAEDAEILPTKGEGYTLPGGENYRETLITLPGGMTAADLADELDSAWEAIAALPGFPSDAYVVDQIGWASEEAPKVVYERWSDATDRKQAGPIGGQPDGVFTGLPRHPSGSAPNVLVYVRHNDRTGPNGERVLFIEEIQDDWAKAGRKRGYRGFSEEKIKRQLEGFDADSDREAFYSGKNYTTDEAWKILSERVKLWDELDRIADIGVPDRPFKSTAQELALRRMIAKAIREGYDSVSWTTGVTQVNRYESQLRKVVDSIGWQRGGVSWVSGDSHLQSEIVVDTRKDNSSVLEMVVDANSGIVIMGSDTDVVDSPLEDVVGKSIAKRILEGGPDGVVEGDNLTIGGQGFIDLYDGKLVKEANRFGKKYGAKVETGEVETERGDVGGGVPSMHKDRVEVHTFKLTPAMSAEAEASGTRMYSLSAADLKIVAKRKQLVSDIPGLSGILPYLFGREKDKLKTNTARRLVKLFTDMPNATELASVAFAGREKRGWYEDSAKALLDIFGVEDAPRFAALLAALSPQLSVESNAKNALNMWVNWAKAGRPTSRKDILALMAMSVEGEFHGDPVKGMDSVMGAWENNTVRALSADDPTVIVLSGPKVNSFMLNLRGYVNEVTNDTWMGIILGVKQAIFGGSLNVAGTDPGKGTGYLAASALARKAAKILSNRTGEHWTPYEVQETAWSWARSLNEQRKSPEEELDAIQIVRKQGGPDIERISETPDFAILFTTGVYKEIIKKGGLTRRVNIAARNRKAARTSRRRRGWNKVSDPGIAENRFNADLVRASKRIEANAVKRYGPKKPKTKLSLPTPRAEASATRYPLESRERWYADADYEARGASLVEMTPDEFLSRTKPLAIDEVTRENIDELRGKMERGEPLDPLTIYRDDLTDVRASDGRHRAIAAKELGMESIPVLDFTPRAEATGRKLSLRVKLGQGERANEGSPSSNFMDEYYEATYPHPFDDSTRALGAKVDGEVHNVETTISIVNEDTVRLSWIQTQPPASGGTRGAGVGSYMLKKLTEIADKHGVSIEGTVARAPGMDEDAGLSASDLMNWYLRNGFEVTGGPSDSPSITRSPASPTPRAEAKMVKSDGVKLSLSPGIIAYHSTNVPEFGEFNTSGLSAHFGTADAATDRARDLRDFSVDVVGRKHDDPRTVKVALDIKNPLEMPDLASLYQSERGEFIRSEEVESRLDEFYQDDEDSPQHPHPASWESETDFQEWLLGNGFLTPDQFWDVQYDVDGAVSILKDNGYDGIAYENAVENPGSISYIPFDASQITILSDLPTKLSLPATPIETVQQMDPNMNDNGTIKRINENATERNKQIARGEIEGEKLSENQKKKYSLAAGQPNFAGDIPDIIRRSVTIKKDQTLFEKIAFFMDKENRPEFWQRLRQRALNQYERAGWMDRELAQKTGNNVYLMAAVASMSAALNSDKARGMFTYALEKGIPVLKKAMEGGVEASWVTMAPFEITMPDGSKRQGGLRTILTPLFANNSNLYPLWSSFMIARREHRFEATGKKVRMNAESRQKIFDEVGYDPETKAWTNSKYPNLEVVDKNYQAWNSAFVDFMVAAGVFTPSEAEIYKSYADYIPFYRQWDGESNAELDENISGLIQEEDMIRGIPRKSRPPSMFHAMTGAQGAKPAKGGEAKVDDPLENILQNAFAGLQAGMKNIAADKVIRNAEHLGLAEATDLAGDSTHTIRRDGIDKHFIVRDELVMEVLSGVMDARMPWLDLLSKPARWLRELITRSPDFLAANLLRDTGSAWVTSGADFDPFTGAIKNMFSGDSDPRWEALERAGVASGFENMNNPEDFRKYSERQWKREGVTGDTTDAWKFFDKIWTGSGKLSTRSDMAVRMDVWQDVVSRMEAEGGHDRSVIEAEADFQASETLNFGRRGSSPYYRILTALVPFTGARFQGLDVLYRAAAGKYGTDYAAVQSGAALMRFRQRAMMVLSLAGMYWLLVHDDDDYLGQTDETRDMNLIIPSSILPGDSPLKFPKPFEVGFMLITVPEAILSWFNDDTDNRDAINTLKRGLIATLHFNPMPQAAKPVYEVMSNYSSWTGRNVVPEHQLGLKSHLQYTDATGEFARLLGKTFGASPSRIEHIIRGYTGTLGSYGLFIVDEATRSMSDLPSRPPLELSDFPMFRRFVGKPGGDTRGNLQKFYDLREVSDLTVNSWRKLRREGRHDEAKELRRESKELFESRGRVLGMDRRVSAIRKRMQRIMLSDIDAAEKSRRMDAAREDLERAMSDVKKVRKESNLPIDRRLI